MYHINDDSFWNPMENKNMCQRRNIKPKKIKREGEHPYLKSIKLILNLFSNEHIVSLTTDTFHLLIFKH